MYTQSKPCDSISFADSASVAPSTGIVFPASMRRRSCVRRVEIITTLAPNSDPEQIARQVALTEGLEVDLVGRFQLALVLQRLGGEAREVLAYLARELEVLQHRLVQRRLDEREAHERVLVVARHGVQHARRGRRLRVGDQLPGDGERLAVGAAAESAVEFAGDRL